MYIVQIEGCATENDGWWSLYKMKAEGAQTKNKQESATLVRTRAAIQVQFSFLTLTPFLKLSCE